MAYGIAKDIAKLSAPVAGKVDRIILTGGVAYSKFLTDIIEGMVSWIAPVEMMPGEYEMEAFSSWSFKSSERRREASGLR